MKTISYTEDKKGMLSLFNDIEAGEKQIEIHDHIYDRIFNQGESAEIENGKIVIKTYDTVKKINKLKKKLQDTDYIIIKQYEKVLLGEELDDVKNIINQRKGWRNGINKLEG